MTIAVEFRDALRRCYVLHPPLPAFYRRLMHLIASGEITQPEAGQMQALMERVMRAKGYDPDKLL